MLKLNLQNSYDKVKFLTLLQFVFVLIAFVIEAFFLRSVLNFSFIFQFILLIVLIFIIPHFQISTTLFGIFPWFWRSIILSHLAGMLWF
jgi:hypothetical protein